MSTTDVFLSGMSTMGFIFAGVFFFRFWHRTKDQLFLCFGSAFWLLAVNQAVLAISLVPREEVSWVYILRILAFGLLIVAIIAKNLGGGRTGTQ